MMPRAVITGLFLYRHFIDGGVDNGESCFSVGSEAFSYIRAASTHVLNPWNIMATLIKMADGKNNPIFRNCRESVMI